MVRTYAQRVVGVLDDSFDEVLATSQLADSVERREDLELVQKPIVRRISSFDVEQRQKRTERPQETWSELPASRSTPTRASSPIGASRTGLATQGMRSAAWTSQRSRRTLMRDKAHRIKLDEAVGDLAQELVLGEVAHAVRTGEEGSDDCAAELGVLDRILPANRQPNLLKRTRAATHCRPLRIRIAIAERMEEAQQPSHELGRPHRLVQSFRREQRSLEKLGEDLERPARVVLRVEDLRLEEEVAEVRVVDLHAHADLGGLDLSLASSEWVIDRVGARRGRGSALRGTWGDGGPTEVEHLLKV